VFNLAIVLVMSIALHESEYARRCQRLVHRNQPEPPLDTLHRRRISRLQDRPEIFLKFLLSPGADLVYDLLAAVHANHPAAHAGVLLANRLRAKVATLALLFI
jgi:hypothetical protein